MRRSEELRDDGDQGINPKIETICLNFFTELISCRRRELSGHFWDSDGYEKQFKLCAFVLMLTGEVNS